MTYISRVRKGTSAFACNIGVINLFVVAKQNMTFERQVNEKVLYSIELRRYNFLSYEHEF
jgi:hypothetical protein